MTTETENTIADDDFLKGTSDTFFLALADDLIKLDWPCDESKIVCRWKVIKAK